MKQFDHFNLDYGHCREELHALKVLLDKFEGRELKESMYFHFSLSIATLLHWLAILRLILQTWIGLLMNSISSVIMPPIWR